MKRFLMFVMLINVLCGSGYAQTYFYKHIEDVDENGAKTKRSGSMYLTFTKTSCYESDENGYKQSLSNIYLYKATKDNLYVYSYDALSREVETDRILAQSGLVGVNTYTGSVLLNSMGRLRYQIFYVSTDYSRINHCVEKNVTEVYVKSDPPKKEEPKAIHFY